MLSLHTPAAIVAAPTTLADLRLRQLLADAVHDWAASELLGLTTVLVVEHGDTEELIRREAGFSPLVDADGNRFGSPGFVPPFDLVVAHHGLYEILTTIGNDGYAVHVFVPDADGVDPELLALCRVYAAEDG